MTVTHHLTKAQRRELEKELRSEFERLERSVTTQMGGDDAGEQQEVRRPDAQVPGGLSVALETRILDRHQMVASALRRLEAGDYGACVSCHKPIPYGRLLAMPEATYCLACGSGV
jgi:DnaK suppressor protein